MSTRCRGGRSVDERSGAHVGSNLHGDDFHPEWNYLIKPKGLIIYKP